MNILLDESAPQNLRLLIDARHTTVTTWYQRWSALDDEALLDAAEEAGFDLFITADRDFGRRKCMAGRRIAAIALSTSNWHAIGQQIGKIVAAVEAAAPGTAAFVELDRPRAGRTFTVPSRR